MIQIQGLSKQFGPQRLWDGLSWLIRPGIRYGLVGPNGAGKTTLLRILSGADQPDGGSIVIPRGVRVGYLVQEVGELPGASTIEAVLLGIDGWTSTRAELAALRRKMAEDAAFAANPSALRALGDATDRFEAAGGEGLVDEARRMLGGLGFSPSMIEGPPNALSGGWRMRVALCRLLLARYDVLLLDEPTNHLDLEALAWFESFLDSYPGTIVVVSHDRAFLDRVPDIIAELSPRGIIESVGGYEDYIEGRAQRIEQQQAAAATVERRRAQLQRFVDRFRAKATKAKQAQSRMKQLAKLEDVEVDGDVAGIGFRFPPAGRTGKEVLRLHDVGMAYGSNRVYEGIELTIWRGMRVALVGPNGAGKSTLLKLLAGVLHPTEGEVVLGHQVRVEHYAQHQLESLDARSLVLTEAQRAASDQTMPKVRSLLGAFLFQGKAVEKRVHVLSGGERARLALCRMVLRAPNTLLLDEPTNHLDLLSREVLEDALSAFDGTVVLVSHDRAFINAVATHVLEVLPGGRVSLYEGDYDAYLYRKSGGDPKAVEAILRGEDPDARAASEDDDRGPAAGETREEARARKRAEAELRAELSRRVKPLRDRISGLEAQIERDEARCAEIAEQQLDPTLYDDSERVRVLAEEHGRLRAGIDDAMAKWEELSLRAEGLEEEIREASPAA
ncbi:MAG: ABC-F family ATP-binding cassette domain-containing protein [Deltaproteobacteria bacterium]|nr:ABC-F family ATP-binding cassette domain-containing protein [Deltaproteobacteria bacterium]